jgi:hypothetical protein
MEKAPNSNIQPPSLETAMPWTEIDVETAEEMLRTSAEYDQNINWIGRMTRSARRMGFDGYADDRLSGVREYISHLGGLAAQEQKDLEDFLKEERLRMCEEAANEETRKEFIRVGESHD